MKQVLVTFSESPTKDYPLAVVIVNEDGSRSQEHGVKSVREGRIFGNGVITGAMHALKGNYLDWPVNVAVDPRMS